MSLFSPKIFKNLVSMWWSFELIPKSGTVRSTFLRYSSEAVKPFPDTKEKLSRLIWKDSHLTLININRAMKLIKEYPNAESVKWKEIQEKLIGLKIENYHLATLQACLNLSDMDSGSSYVKYIIKSREELSVIELLGFMKVLSERKDLILIYEDLIKYCFDKIKVYMKDSPLLQSYVIDMITEVPSCFYELSNSLSEEQSLHGRQKLITKALMLEDFKLANELGNIPAFKLNDCIVLKYLKFMHQMAVEDKFSPHMITTFTKLLEEKTFVLNYNNFFSYMKSIVGILNKTDKNYNWSFQKCLINEYNICSNCQVELIDKCISESEFKKLKLSFLPSAGLFDKNIFISSSENELIRFFQFLKSSKPYNIVFDGLNLIYQAKSCAQGELSRYLKYFLDKGLNVLIIAKIHAKKKIYSIPFLTQNKYQNKCQFFFTENLSDDDIFVIYAALHKGLKTYVFSGDFLECYGARFNDDVRQIFIKWKLYHLYLTKTFCVYPPRPSLGLSQLTVDEDEKKFIWHISYKNGKLEKARFNSLVPLNWICLKATKKIENQDAEINKRKNESC